MAAGISFSLRTEIVLYTYVQVLLIVADKYDMPAIMERCIKFLTNNINTLNSSKDGPQCGCKWIALADAVGQGESARAIVDGVLYILNTNLPKHSPPARMYSTSFPLKPCTTSC